MIVRATRLQQNYFIFQFYLLAVLAMENKYYLTTYLKSASIRKRGKSLQ